MKNNLVFILLLGLIFSCGPSEEKVAKLTKLMTEWENTTENIGAISKEIGDQMYLLENKKEESQASETNNATGEESTCENEYASLKENAGELISTWKESTTDVEELKTRITSGQWTSEDDENLEALSNEAKNAQTNVELWREKLAELKSTCEVNSDNSNS
ncbi:hypothetical protein LZF95_10815 [Algoriphagus sp. AGSA1]|uniref:hypothetical protein n=1 Tax=Algoriphagus sp. AGSA1 TaxID=2907213 RepID=UPI001F45E4F1|nr:hypothetical protein [Algoriphagus sp. AGSA1]MCE7055167.1 hypothetical protein [Algoriphagus sp. AGSA1]